jgi:transcription antitermination factor NusG
MSQTTSQSKILAKLQKRSKGAYQKVKDHEAKAGGRSLPGGIEGGIAEITNAKLDETKNGDPYFFIYSTVTSPPEYQGVFVGLMYQLYEDQYATLEDKFDRLCNDLKLMHPDLEKIIIAAKDESEMITKVEAWLKKSKISFVFNTGRKQKKDGTYSIFVQGQPEEGHETPQAKGENKHQDQGYVEAKLAFSVGDRVKTVEEFYADGNEYHGEVTEVEAETEIATVKFDDGDVHDIPFASLVLEEGAPASQKEEDEPSEVLEQAPDCVACGGKGKSSRGRDCAACGGSGKAAVVKSAFEVGDRVVTVEGFFDEGVFEGEVTEVAAHDKITVTFDDGDVLEVTHNDIEHIS